MEMDLSVVGKICTCCKKFKVFQVKTLRALLLWKKLSDKKGEAIDPSDTHYVYLCRMRQIYNPRKKNKCIGYL
jgi:hypothetical protein